MKTFFLSLTLLLSSFTAQAHFVGWDTGNAGDSYAREVFYTARDLLQRLESLELAGKPLMPTADLRRLLKTVQIGMEDGVSLNGIQRDAVSYPSERKMIFNRARWKEYRQPQETKARLALVLHELFWMLDIDDTNYAKSSPIVEALAVPPYSPSLWLENSGAAFAAVECTGKLADGTFVTVLVSTKGATRVADRGEVQIEQRGNRFGYRFAAEEMAQFFENDDAETNLAMVGLGAYVGGEFPVAVKYQGTNFVDMDLRVVIDTGASQGLESARNFLRVWKGPGYSASEQYTVQNPVCSISAAQ